MARATIVALVAAVTVGPGWPAVAGAQGLEGVIPEFETMEPVIRKVWIPQQQLYREYKWRSFQYTNYARELYERYTDIELQGERWYDLYGNYITRGWLVYDWSQEQGAPFGSDVVKRQQYASWFSRLVVGHDASGQYSFSVTIGDEIRSALTPLTFSKPAFNGIQVDFLSDKYSLTVVASRVSAPVGGSTVGVSEVTGLTDFANLLGGHGAVQLGDFVNLGATYLNVHLGTTDGDQSFEHAFRGELTTDQNREVVREITVRISDDSPGPGDRSDGAAAFFSEEIWTRRVDPDGKVIKEWGPEPIRPFQRGGVPRQGYWVAEGGESIELTYAIPFPHQVDRVAFQLVVSNDYRIEVTSNRQTNVEQRRVFLPVARAADNVHDNSNQRVVRFEYSLPTAREVFGFTVDAPRLLGAEVRGEWAASRLHGRYPNVNFADHAPSSRMGRAWYLTARRHTFPWYGYAEAFSIDDDYGTDMFIIGGDRRSIDYENRQLNRFELVDDNEDQDRFPDWSRANQSSDRNGVFPGLDANNDFRSDFNQNANKVPDYEEPFLRYRVDPPEFLFGVDMDHNTLVDIYEDDDLPDYPYLPDHRGVNGYVGVELVPDVDLRLGYAREWLWSDDRESRDTYALLTVDKEYLRLGRLRVFEHVRLVADDIPDDQLVWRDITGKEEGILDEFSDLLPAQDAVVNDLFLGFDYDLVPNLHVGSSLKYQAYFQRGDNLSRLSSVGAPPDTLQDAHFAGVINRVDYTFQLERGLMLQPRLKSVFRWREPFQRTRSLFYDRKMKNLLEIAGLLVRKPLMRRVWFEQGAELVLFRDFESDAQDFYETIVSAQVAMRQDYLGYKLAINLGGRWNRRVLDQRVLTGGQSFITVFAGLE